MQPDEDALAAGSQPLQDQGRVRWMSLLESFCQVWVMADSSTIKLTPGAQLPLQGSHASSVSQASHATLALSPSSFLLGSPLAAKLLPCSWAQESLALPAAAGWAGARPGFERARS